MSGVSFSWSVAPDSVGSVDDEGKVTAGLAMTGFVLAGMGAGVLADRARQERPNRQEVAPTSDA